MTDIPVRQSPSPTSKPTYRVVEILNYLSAHPDRSAGASELARELGMAKSTCLSVLTTLTESGYLIQHPTRKDYRLGPGVIAAGRAALARFPDLHPAHAILAEASASLRMPISASTVADEQIIVLEVFGRTDPFGGYPSLLVRLPFQPPYGSGFVGWAEPDMWERWLNRAPQPLRPEQVDRLREALAEARQHGFLVSIDIPEEHRLSATRARMRNQTPLLDLDDFTDLAVGRLSDVPYLVGHVEPEAVYDVSLIQAPVLPPPRREPLTLTALAFGRAMTGDAVLEAGHTLADAARAVAKVCR
jgi:DNA-binding IclR family transcriptional regulator